MKKFLITLSIIISSFLWIYQSNASYTRVTMDQLYWSGLVQSFNNFYDSEFNISQVDVVLNWDYSTSIAYILDWTFETCDSSNKIYSWWFTTFSCVMNGFVLLINDAIQIRNAITFDIFTQDVGSWTWTTSTWSLNYRANQLISWWRYGVNKLLNWSIWTIISFLIWFLILWMVVYKLNQVFWWFSRKK